MARPCGMEGAAWPRQSCPVNALERAGPRASLGPSRLSFIDEVHAGGTACALPGQNPQPPPPRVGAIAARGEYMTNAKKTGNRKNATPFPHRFLRFGPGWQGWTWGLAGSDRSVGTSTREKPMVVPPHEPPALALGTDRHDVLGGRTRPRAAIRSRRHRARSPSSRGRHGLGRRASEPIEGQPHSTSLAALSLIASTRLVPDREKKRAGVGLAQRRSALRITGFSCPLKGAALTPQVLSTSHLVLGPVLHHPG